jgi:hypothetical protein
MNAGSGAGNDGETTVPQGEEPAIERGSGEQAVEGEGRPEQTAGGRRPAVTRRATDDEDDESSPRAVTPSKPPEPEAIDTENAAFVLLGVGLVVGFVLAAVAGF